MRTIQALTIQPDGTTTLVALPNEEPQSLKARQETVGGMIEAFYFDHAGAVGGMIDAFMWINEEGKYTLGPDSYNGLATDLVRHRLMFSDWICGPVVIVGQGRGGDDNDVPNWVVRTVKAYPDCRWVE